MSIFIVKGKFFLTKHIWFEDISSVTIGGYDKLIIHGSPTEEYKIGKYKCKCLPQETLISNLTLSEENLWSLTTKTIRNEINRCKREMFQVKMYCGAEITDEILYAFKKMYHNMYEEKGMQGHNLPLNELKEYANNDSLIVTKVSIGNNDVVFHSYIKDNKKARLLHSCSEFRVAETAMRNAIGRANKYLHWNDILYFKELGVQEYDWGGISSFVIPNGIDKFKIAFGGAYRKYYNLYCDCSIKSKIVSPICNNKFIAHIILKLYKRDNN